jgi:hypothetical protein
VASDSTRPPRALLATKSTELDRAGRNHPHAYAGPRGHISPRSAAGESVPAVAESCGTSRKTIIAHYHEALGDEFERPYPPFAEQFRRLRERCAPTADGRRLRAV